MILDPIWFTYWVGYVCDKNWVIFFRPVWSNTDLSTGKYCFSEIDSFWNNFELNMVQLLSELRLW